MTTTPQTTTIQLRSSEEALLTQLADKTGRSKDAILRQILEEGLEDLDDALVAQEAIAKFHASGEPAIPHHEIWRELGLDD
ncbi:MAG: DUF6290 family protein [Cyanobium sp. 49614_E6]|jgi:predicted DNA-binding protein|nr:DUF6290 family protein [Cyanobium sp. 49614_E6]MCE2839638.1 DUF6290 family protein [Cyanobium sp. 49614_E6]